MILPLSHQQRLSGNSILGENIDHKPNIHEGLWSFDFCSDNILITELFIE